MKYLNSLFFILLLYISRCYAIPPPLSINNFGNFITCVRDGNPYCLKTISHHTVHGLNFKQSIMLRDALAHSLIKSPDETISALNKIDTGVGEKNNFFISDNYGSDMVCSYMINTNKYDRESFFKYYVIAKAKLKGTGDKGRYCLEIMTASVEETLYEEKKGKMMWGTEKYPF